MVEQNIFQNVTKLKTFSLMANKSFESRGNFLKQLIIEKLEVSDFKICCLSPEAQCSIRVPWHFCCQTLLPNTALWVSFLSVSVSVIILNILSVVIHKISFHKDPGQKTGAYGVTVSSVNVVDILYSMPLLMLFSVDSLSVSEFSLGFEKWTSGSTCFVVFGMFCMFSVVSPLVLCFLAVSRLMLVKHPVDTNYKETKFVRKRALAIVTFSVMFAVSVTILVWLFDVGDSHSGLPTALCSPFVDPTNEMVSIKILTWMIFVLQVTSLSTTTVLYIQVCLTLKQSQQNFENVTRKGKSYHTTFVQLAVISISNWLCWIPGSIVNLLTTFLSEYPIEMSFWTVVAVSPINSLVYPAVFNVMALKKLYNLKKKAK